MKCSIRTISVLILFALFYNQLAHAAHMPRKLAHLSASTPAPAQQQAATDFPATRQHLAQVHTVYLVNDGVDRGFPLKADDLFRRVQTQFLTWGYYQLVPSVDQADLVLNLHGTTTVQEYDSTNADGTPSTSYVTSYSARLTAIDPQTQAPLATVETPFRSPTFGRSKWLNTDIVSLVANYKLTANQPLTAQDQAAIEALPSRAPVLIFALVSVGLMGGLTMLAVHEFHKSQDDFNKAVQEQNAEACKLNPFFCH